MEHSLRTIRPLIDILAPVAALVALAAAGVGFSPAHERSGLELREPARDLATTIASARDAAPLPRQWRWRPGTVELGTMIRDGARR